MKNKININRTFEYKKIAIAISSAMLLTNSSMSFGQDEADDKLIEEVVVTGSLIRGIQPVGSQTIGIDEMEIENSSATTTNELLGSLPQVTNFFNQRPEQDPRGASRITVNRPNLRGLPGINSASGATTLILMNGNRVTPVGVLQSSFDPNMIPLAVIERVEVITDGGSSMYGADAVGGVMNFVTKKEFDGVQVDLGHSMGDDYSKSTLGLTAGKSWNDGNGYISISTSQRDQLLNKDRDFAAQGIWSEDLSSLSGADTECLSPVGAVTTWRWIPGYNVWTDNPLAGAGTVTLGEGCDRSSENSYLPEEETKHIFGSMTQNLTDNIKLDVTAYHSERTINLGSYARGYSVLDPAPTQDGTVPFEAYIQNQVGFSFGAHPSYVQPEQDLTIKTWGITPSLTVDFNNGWQLRSSFHYGRSDNSQNTPSVNQQVAKNAITNGSLLPTNVAAADAGLIANILNWENADESVQEMYVLKTVADGSIFKIGDRDAKIAIGLDYQRDDAQLRQGTGVYGFLNSTSFKNADRDITSIYSELSLPVLESLDISLSVRNDDYSSFGQTTNSNIGFTWHPTETFKLFGHWGESFNAPTLMDKLGVSRIMGYYPFGAFIINPRPDGTKFDAMLAEGAGGDLQPQTAETWAVGFEVEPVESLTISANYYDIDFVNLLGQVNPVSSQSVILNPERFIFNPTQEQYDAFIAQMDNASDWEDQNISNLGVIVDRRTANTKQARLKGIDFRLNYLQTLSNGSLNWGLNGTKTTDFILTDNGISVDQLANNNSDMTMVASLDWSSDNVRAGLKYKHTPGFNVDDAIGQDEVKAFNIADLYMSYDFESDSGITNGLTLRLNVDNVLDKEPAVYRRNGGINYAGFTLGRVVTIGLSKKF